MAIELFDRGLSQMEAGDYEHGCPALRESLRLAPRAGTVFTVAECEARWGRHASALAHYDDYLSRFGKMTPPEQRKQRARELVARKQLLELKRMVPHLVVRLADATPGSSVLTVDDVEIGGASLGQPLPVDPGKHVIRLRGDGVAFTTEVQLEAAQTLDVLVPARTTELRRAAPAPVVAPAPAAAPPEPAHPPAPPPSSSRGTVAWVLAGGGALATLGGLTLGVLAVGQKGTIDEHCSGHLCDAEGTSAASRAQTLGLASTVVTSVGIAAIGTATVLWLTAPKRGTESARLHPRPTAWAGKHEGFVGLEGSFQ